MGYKRKVPCATVGCTNFAQSGSAYCEEHTKSTSTSRSQWKYMYNSRWDKARYEWLKTHIWCEECLKEGKHTLANTVHHKIEHKGDYKLFWDKSNWEAICASCHSRIHAPNMNKWK